MMNPPVSIIIPNLNCLSFLPACFETIRHQQLPFYEVLVVDDGSTDGSLAYLKNEELHWPQLRVLQQDHQGPGAARNLAAQFAKAPLLAFLDADDSWPEQKLAQQVKYHQENPEIGLSFTDYQHIDESTGAEVIRCFDYWPEFSHYLATQKATPHDFEKLNNAQAMLLAENVIGTSSVVVSRSAFMAVQGFDTSLPSASDWDLWLKISKISAVGFHRDCLMNYLQRRGSVSSNFKRRFQAVDIIMHRYIMDVEPIWPEKARSARAAHAIAKREMWQSEQQNAKAFWASMQALWLKPCARQVKNVLHDFIAVTKN